MNNNSDGSNLSENSFNGSRMAEICRELSGEAKNRDLGSDSDCNRDIDYRYFVKILMERDRSPNSRESSCSRSQWAENSREHRREQYRNRDRGRDGEWNRERDNFLPPYNYNAADLLNSFVDSNRRDMSMRPAYNDGPASPWNNYPVDGMNQSNAMINQSSFSASMPPNYPVDGMNQSNPMINQSSFPVSMPPNYPVDRMNQSNAMINQSSFPVSMPPNLEMAQSSSSNINQMSAPWNIDPMNQSNMTVNQDSSAAPVSSDPIMAHTSNSRINPKRTRWNNPMDDVTMNQSNLTMIQSSALPVSSNLEMTETSNSSVNPNTSRTEMENYSQYNTKASEESNFPASDKEIIRLTLSVLYPPSPIAPRPTRNEKPKGCKTIFVGGLPAKITEEITKEIFEKCGPVENIRMSLSPKKNFCHVRFFKEKSVENAMNLSGYRLKIENKEDTLYSSRIHVDYAKAKNDQRDYERKQRLLWQTGQFQKADIDTKSPNNATMNQSSSGVPRSSSFEMRERETSNSSANSCAFMTGIGNFPLHRVIAPQKINFASPVKEVIQFTKCVLYPPDPTQERPATRIKNPGCKTVFVGGLPFEITKEIIKDIFQTCGVIKNVRMPTDNFCHVQFRDELSVDNAIYFSGYTLKIENKDEAPFCGKLNVHYSQAKEDEREYELKCKNKETSRFCSPYTEYEASRICEKLKFDETFSKGACVLIRWLERGECKKKEASIFYSMIQCTQNQVKKLQDDKVKYEETLNQAKSIFKKQMDGNIQKFIEIEKIFNAACVQKCWDNFTKTQRKNIEMWKKQSEEIKNAHLEEVINEREDEEMELSDDENDASKKNDVGHVRSQYKEYVQKLQEETNSLKCQLEAAQKEIKAAQSEQEESKNKDNQLSAIRTALQNSMKEVLDLNLKYSKAEAELKELRGLKCTKEGEQNEDNDLSHDGDDAGVSSSINIDKGITIENDVRLVSLISSFLIVQPFGATVDYIWPYLHQIDSSINVSDVENLMKRFPTLFKEESTGTESSLEKKWKFIGFQTSPTLS